MLKLQKAIVLKAPSAYRKKVILLSENAGKIEGFVVSSRVKGYLSHGAIISCVVVKQGTLYKISDVEVLDMPLYWARENFLFFHHILELYNWFLPWDENAHDLFELLSFLYSNPDKIKTKHDQKVFLCSFFRHLGMYPEESNHTLESWLKSCINEHPQAILLQTAGFLKTLEIYEEAA